MSLFNLFFANNTDFSKILSILESQQDMSSPDFYFYHLRIGDFFWNVAFT